MPLASDNPYAWSLSPGVLAALVLLAIAYGGLLRELAIASGGGARLTTGDWVRTASFGAGLIVLAAAFVSPIDALGEKRLFSVHMAQHLLIMDIAPILLLLGLSRRLLRPVVRRVQPIERALGPVAHPLTALLVMVGVVWLWHVPPLYELTLESAPVHALEHASFFAAGLAFWWYVLEPIPPRNRLRGMWPVAYVAGAKLLLGALGLVLAFAPSALYDTYEQAPRTWGLSALADQNVGGLAMMLEQSIVLAAFFALAFARMIERSEQAERRRERLSH